MNSGNMRISIYILLVLLIPFMASAQSGKTSRAEKAIEHNNYVKAVKLYKKAYEEQKQDEIAFRIAQAYAAMNQINEAIPWYQAAISSGSDSARYYIAYGKAIAKTEKFENALLQFRKALQLDPDNEEAKSGIEAVQMAMETRSMDSPVEIARVQNINSEFSEYGPGFLGKDLVFASTRIIKNEEKIDGRTGQGYSDLYRTSFDNETNAWSAPQIVEGPLNSKYNDGTFAFDAAKGIAYTMRCNEKQSKCILIACEYDMQNDSWGESSEIDMDLDEYSLGHPALSSDGNTLYFVSDMSGGHGGKDIWKSFRKNDGSWGLPINLGDEVNSAANDLFPFLLGDSILFFASDRDLGFGGLDIYYAFIEGSNYTSAVNMGYPFNSTSDDFGMIIKKDLQGGFFTSNRIINNSDDIYGFNDFPLLVKVAGTVTDIATGIPVAEAEIRFKTADTEKTVTTDEEGKFTYFGIMPFKEYKVTAVQENYHPELRTILLNPQEKEVFNKTKQINFELGRKSYPVTIKGSVLDRSTGKPMPGETVQIKDRSGFSASVKTNDEGIYAFKNLKPEASYGVKVSKEGYFSESRSIDIPAVKEPRVFSSETGYDMDFLLTKIEKKKEIVLNNIYYDFDKATLRPESKTELNKLASMLKETPNVDIQINSHTDERGWDSYNQKLSERRAQSVVDYLISRGISPDRLKAQGYGEKNPIVKNAKTEDEHQKNRRTSFKVMNINEVANEEIEEPEEDLQTERGLEYRIQLMSTSQPIPGFRLFSEILDSIEDTHVFVDRENGMYKYQIGTRNSLASAVELKNKIIELGYADAFINAYFEGEKVSIEKAKELENTVNKK